MTIERIKGGISFLCDLPGCHEGVETGFGSFSDAADAAKADGWKFANRDGVWKHFCCGRHEEMQYRGQSLVITK